MVLPGLAALLLLVACSTGNLSGLEAARDGGATEGGGGALGDGAAGSGGSFGTDAGGCDGGDDAGCKPAVPCSPNDSPCTDDGNPCTTDICKSGSCQHNLLAEGVGCGNGKVCSAAGKCSAACGIGGKLYAAGATNPANACETCDPAKSPSAWTPAADGAPCADDGDSCTKDECASGICTHPDLGVGDSCGSGKVCDATLACKAGCVISGQFYADGEIDPSNSCQSCDAAKSTSAWSSLADTAACTDDGNPCTSDECQAGVCTHPDRSNTTTCGSGGHCKSGQCTASCLIGNTSYPEGTLNPANPCESCQSAKNASGWSPVLDDTQCGSSSCGKYGSCSYSSSCDTSGTKKRTCTDHVCKAGVCTAPTHAETAGCTRTTDGDSCTDDGSPCTSDTCSGGSCTHPKLAGGTSCGSSKICDGNGGCIAGCWISGTLYQSGATKPGNTCQSCQPASSTSAWTNVSNANGETICASSQCGQYGSCSGFSDVCAESGGTHSRTCTDYTCNAGVCTGTDRTDTGSCTRNTDGTACATDNNACTSDTCSGGTCAHTALPDGTSCGPNLGCENYLCGSGICISKSTCPAKFPVCCPGGACISPGQSCP